MNHTEQVDANLELLVQRMKRKAEGRVSAKWQTMADVDWDDLEHFVDVCKRKPDAESFNTAMAVLEALRKQVLGR